jgi:hypothetical protein
MAEDNPLEGQDPNEVQGVDPSQSAFQPMLDENIPEDLNRTTTTTTMYISGAPTTPQETVPIIGENIEEVSDPFMPSMISDDSVLRARVEELLSQYKNISRRDEPKLRKIKETLLSEDPDGEWRDERFDDKINLTKRFPDLFPKYAAYTKGIEDRVKDGVDPMTLIGRGKAMGPYGQKTFGYLWDAVGYGKEKVNEVAQNKEYIESVFTSIQDGDLKKLTELGDPNILKNQYPSQKAAIEFMVVTDALKKDLSLEDLEDLKKNNPTKSEIIQPAIDNKVLQNDPNYDQNASEEDDDYVSEDFNRMQNINQYGFDPVAKKGYDPYNLGRDSKKYDTDIPFDEFAQQQISEERKELVTLDWFTNDEYVDDDGNRVDFRDHLDVKFADNPKEASNNINKQRNNQKEILDQINKNSTSSIDTEELYNIYLYGEDMDKMFNPDGEMLDKYKDIQDKAFNLEMSMVNSVSFLEGIAEETYKRNGTSKEFEEYKRKTILEYSDKPMEIMGNMYTPEQINEMFEIAEQRFIQNVGEEELELFNYITGATKLEQYNNQYVKDGMMSSNPEIENAIVVDDEDATVANLNSLFAGTSFKFRVSDEGSGYDAIEIYTEVDGLELLSSGAIFIDDEKKYTDIVSFMATAMPTAEDKRKIREYESFLDREGGGYKYNNEAEFLFTMYMLENYERFDIGGDGAIINIENARKFTDDVMANSWIPKDKLALFKTLIDTAQIADHKRESTQEAGILDVIKSKFTSGVYQTVINARNLFDDFYMTFAEVPEYVYARNMFTADGERRTKSEAKDLTLKGMKRESFQLQKKLTRLASGSDVKEAFMQENANEIFQVSGFLAESIAVSGSVGGPWGSPLYKTLAFVQYATNGIEEQMSSRDFDGLTEWEKKQLSLPYGMTMGALERVGFEGSLGAYKNTFFGKFARDIINQSVKNLPKNASKELLETTIQNNVKARFIDGSIRIIGGSLSEGFVEGTQEVFDVGAKKTYELLTDNIGLFSDIKDLDLGTVDGWIALRNRVGESAWLGLLGGGFGASGGIALNSVTSGVVNVKNNREFDNYYQSISNEKLLNNQKIYVQYNLQDGKIDKAQAKAQIDALDQAYSISTEIPTDFTTNQKKQAYELLTERKNLERQIEGKEKNLISTQTERIKDIDRQLELISKGGFKDAIQESETKEEVLPDEQSEVGLQDVGQGDTQEQEAAEVQQEISPENSSNYANLTEDNDGNMVFYHVGDKGYETIKPAAGKTTATSREEAGALSKVGGMTMMYTQESDGESMVTGEATYEVKVPKSKVYDFNTDKDNFIEEAKERHEKENPGKAFDPNTQVAYVSQVAAENGYEVVVSEWDGRTRAQSVKEMPISDVKTRDGNKITKDFKENYQSNKEKGFESVIPANKEDQLDEVYQKIKTEKGKSKEYDETYFLFDAMSRRKNYNQDQITKMINESNLSQEVKEEYNVIMEAKPEQRRSVKTRDNIAGVEIQYPNAQQEQERKEERTKPEYVNEAANKNQEEDIESFQAELEGEFGMLTGENPMGKPLTEQENQQLNEKAEEYLKEKGYKPRKITGKYGQAENSFFVPGLTKEDAISFAKEFNQESVAHSEGMVFQDGMMNPRTKSTDNFKMDQYTPESDFVSVVKTKDGLKTFTVGYDFKNKVESTPKPKAKKTTREASRLQQQVDKAKKAIAKILPGVNMVVHKTEDSYRKATGETDSKKQATRGEYNPNTKTIHINPSKANNRTVAHEVFHAILLDKVKTDKGAKDLTERMIKSLSKNLDAMPEVKQAIDTFASNYDENIQSEEKLAELVGILAENYSQMNKPSQSLIKRFLDRLAKMFGLKPFTDNEVVDVLNTIAGKVAVGEEIADVDLKVIPQSVVDEKMSDTARKQAEDLFLSKDKPKLKSTKDVAEWLENWSKENKVFDKDIKDLSDSEIVDKFADNITLELTAWEKVRKDDYVSFYDKDIVEKTNPILQEYAKKEYGRPLTDTEVKLYHLVSAFASPSANPEMDSWKGFDIFDRFMKTGELSGYSDKIATEWEWTTSKTGKEVRKDTGRPRLDKEGKPMRSKVTPAYSQTGLDKFNTLIDKMGGDIDMAMDWITSEHSYKEVADMFGLPEKGPKALKQNEYMSKENGGFGVFGMTGAKLGSYILNRFQNFSTVTKDMWYARTMARLAGQDLVAENKKTKKKGAIKIPWAESTVQGRRIRGLADKAFQEVAKTFDTSPAMIQERIWDFEKRMYEMLGANEDAAYTSDGLKKGIERAKESPSKRKQLVIGENADLKQNVKDFLLDANQMESEGKSREEIRLATGWERGADNKWGYELNDVIDIDVNNIEKNKTYDIQDVVSFQELFDAYPDAKKLKVKFIDNARKSGIAAYYTTKGLIEVNLSKIRLVDYVQDNMAKSRLSRNPDVLAAAVREANLLIKQKELEKEGVSKKSDRWNKETQDVYSDNQLLIDRKIISDYLKDNNTSYANFFKDVRSIERLILKKKDINIAKGIDELNAKMLHEIQHAIADIEGFAKGGSASNIQETFTEKEKKEYFKIVNEVNRMTKLFNEKKITIEEYRDAKDKAVEYRYKKYEELAGETMSRNVERRRKLSPEQRREKTLESTMDVAMEDQKILYEDEKNISIKDKKVEEKKPKEKKGFFSRFKKRKQKDDGPSRERVDKIIDEIVKKVESRSGRKFVNKQKKLDATLAYLQGSKLYQEATDIEREQIVKDLNEKLDINIKKAPSVRKVLGKEKRTKVTVDQMAEYKRQIRSWNKSARLAKKDLNTRRKELGTMIKSMVKGGIMTPKQATILVDRASKINLENETIVNRFLDYAEKVFENAEYAQKFREASSLRRKIKRAIKSDNQAEVIAMGKQFASIDPQMVEVLDLYMDYADQMFDALRPSKVKGTEVDMRQAADLSEVAEFYDGAIKNQDRILKKEMIAKYQDLGLTEDMSLNEIKEIVDAIESKQGVKGNDAQIRSFLMKRFEVMSSIAKQMIKTKTNPFTAESIDLTEKQVDMVSRLTRADISTMGIKEAIRFVEYMDNFITNEITSGLESAVKIYKGNLAINKLDKRGLKARMPKLAMSEAVGKLWNEQLTSLPLLFERVFQGATRGLKVMKEIGVQDIANGNAKKTQEYNKVMKKYSERFIEKDPRFMDPKNVYERGMFAFLSRNLIGTKKQQSEEFQRRKTLIEETISRLEKNGDRREKKKGEIYKEVYNDLAVSSAKDISSVRDNVQQKNINAVEWWMNEWADKYSDLADVSLSVYNNILGNDTNYTPDKYKSLTNKVDLKELERSIDENGAFMSDTHVDRNRSGVLMETNRPKILPKGRYVSFDFEIDNFNSMDKALTDIYTAAAIQQFYGAASSKKFDEVFGKTSRLIQQRVTDYINNVKGKGAYMNDKDIFKVFNTIAKFGVSKALGSVSQALKQTAPVMMNTMTNAGRFDFATRSDLDWVNNSGMSMVNRGIEAETAIDSADSKIDVNTSDTVRTLGKKIDQLQGMYLKAFLQAPDVYIAKSSLISYYKQFMKRNGLSTDIVEGQYNQEALEYAQMMVDRQQNISDSDMAGGFLGKPGNVALVRKVIAPFSSFVLNQKARMMSDLRTLNPANKAPTNEDKQIAARSLAGLVVELTVFHTLSAAIREGYKALSKNLFGDDEEEEELEWGSLESNKKIWNLSKYAFSSAVKDVLSPFPFVFDGAVAQGINLGIEFFDINLADEADVQRAVDEENEIRFMNKDEPMTVKEIEDLRKKIMDQGKLSVYEDDSILDNLGVLSIGMEAIQEFNDDYYRFYKDGYYEEDSSRYGKQKKYLLDRDKEGLGTVSVLKFLQISGLAPKDAGDIARYGLKEIKNKTISEQKYKKYIEIKKDLKREPTDGELYLILNSSRKTENISEDIKRWNKYHNGITEKEAKEFLELKKYNLGGSRAQLEDIKKGKTAKEIKQYYLDLYKKTGSSKRKVSY